jgi:hypothetical protein
MFSRVASLCALTLSLAACGGSEVTVKDTGQAKRHQSRSSSGESLTIVGTVSGTEESLVECVESALYKQDPDLSLIPSREFRDATFPWFEPGTAPDSAEALEQAMGKAAIGKSFDELGLRYLVMLSGATTSKPGSWGGCVGGYAGAACVGGMSTNEETNLTVRILDLKDIRELGQVEASGSGKSELGMIVIIPYFLASAAEADTCAAVARRLVEFL